MAVCFHQQSSNQEGEAMTKDEVNRTIHEDVCPDCDRVKAASVYDVLKGYCPKWWAIRDADAERDCRRTHDQRRDK